MNNLNALKISIKSTQAKDIILIMNLIPKTKKKKIYAVKLSFNLNRGTAFLKKM